MATVKQLLTIQAKISAKRSELDKLEIKRRELLDASPDIKQPRGWNDERAENFVEIDGKLCRLFVYRHGLIQLEELQF